MKAIELIRQLAELDPNAEVEVKVIADNLITPVQVGSGEVVGKVSFEIETICDGLNGNKNPTIEVVI